MGLDYMKERPAKYAFLGFWGSLHLEGKGNVEGPGRLEKLEMLDA